MKQQRSIFGGSIANANNEEIILKVLGSITSAHATRLDNLLAVGQWLISNDANNVDESIVSMNKRSELSTVVDRS